MSCTCIIIFIINIIALTIITVSMIFLIYMILWFQSYIRLFVWLSLLAWILVNNPMVSPKKLWLCKLCICRLETPRRDEIEINYFCGCCWLTCTKWANNSPRIWRKLDIHKIIKTDLSAVVRRQLKGIWCNDSEALINQSQWTTWGCSYTASLN